MSADRINGTRWPGLRWLSTLLSICIVLCSAGIPSFAAECRKVNTVCAEAGGTRNIGGVDVTRDCWRYEDSYECVAPNSVDYCAAIAATPSCVQMGSVCTQTAFDGTCLNFQNTYRCGNSSTPAQGVVVLANTYTIVSDTTNTAQCTQYQSNPDCTLAAHTCVAGPETRTINGMPVYKDCWQWSDDYVCASPQRQSDCGALNANAACTSTGSRCLENLKNGSCSLLERQYQCKVKEGTTSTTTTCATGVCVNGDCSGPTSTPDTDMAKVLTALELSRQGGVYMDPATMEIFKGAGADCTVKLGGLVNCCHAKGGGGGGLSIANSMMFQGVKVIGNEAVQFLGSKYVYDALSNDLIPTELLSALYGSSTGSSYTLFGGGNLSFYGITFVPGLDPPFAFDPYTFAAAIAIQIISQYLQCAPSEQQLAMKKDQRLCTYAGSFCSKKFLGVCLEKKESSCCYNSRLARIINEQGRAQIGKTYGNPKSPNCSGFTPDQLQALDFSKMDLAEFFDEIVPKNLDTNLLNARAVQAVQQQTVNYFNNPKLPTKP
jgi:conjugal transfer mating pair stabilization protein TraN